MRPRMPLAETINDDDGWVIFQGGRKRLVSKQALTVSLESRMAAIEQAPNNNALAQRIDALDAWRADKAAAIGNTTTDMGSMGVTVLGVNVASSSAVQARLSEHATKINAILGALREREVINA